MRVNIEGQTPFLATKGFLVDAAPRLGYSMETVGNEPVLRFEVRPAGEMPSCPINEAPTPVKGWTFIPTPPDTNLGHLLENNARLSNRRRAAHYRHGGRCGSGTERKVAWPDISCPGMIEESRY